MEDLNELRRKAQELIDLDTQSVAEYVPVWNEYIQAANPSAVLALLSRLEQAEQGRAQAVADYEAAELKLLHVRDLSEYLKKLAPGDKHYAGLIDRALDGEPNE